MKLYKFYYFLRKYKRIIMYYLIACSISWPFYWWRDINPESWKNWDIPTIVKTWTYMWGPGIAVIIISFFNFQKDKDTRQVTFFGTSIFKSLVFWFVPFILLAIPGIENDWGIDRHLFVIYVFSILGFISIIGEDLGWALYLKNQLLHIPIIKRSIIIGTLWELWHFTNRIQNKTILQALFGIIIMVIILSALSYLISIITDKTKSLVTAVSIHTWINVISETNERHVYIVFFIVILFWIFMLRYWNNNKNAYC